MLSFSGKSYQDSTARLVPVFSNANPKEQVSQELKDDILKQIANNTRDKAGNACHATLRKCYSRSP